MTGTLMECVPNFSEGRDLEKIEKIVNAFRGKQSVKLLDYSNDEDHNRCVVTVVGEPNALKDAVIEAIGIATEYHRHAPPQGAAQAHGRNRRSALHPYTRLHCR